MRIPYIPKPEVKEDMGETKLSTFANPMRMKALDNSPEIPDFKQVMGNMLGELNSVTKAPDQALQDSITNNGADIHDVMIAISKAELGINIATQITTKVVQAYEKVMSIQV